MSFSYTDNQLRAIKSRGSALLVSAAAGSGKTRVLTQRVMDYITDPLHPESIDRFLIITYTRAAAAEMRGRIMDALSRVVAESPGDARLRREQDKCCCAQIGTIHSFCTTVLRENCHLLGLPPAFRVLDEDKAARMKSAALERLLDERYEHMDAYPGFKALADTVGAGRDDRRLATAVLDLYEKMRSHPYPEDWASAQIGMLDGLGRMTDASQTVWGLEVLRDISGSAEYWLRRLESATEQICSADEKIIKAYGSVFSDDAAALRDFIRALSLGWDKAREHLPPEKFPPLGRLVKYENTALKDSVKAVRDGYKKAAAHFRRSLSQSSGQLLADLEFMAPAMKALLRLCIDLEHSFAADKKREGCLDFSDLEHMCAGLLVDKESGKPTWLAVELSQRYREIMVDEYQDVNAIQDMIFRAISREESNLFLVGDVKQSIYRFRLADPGIFLKKYDSYADWTPDSSKPRRIMLQENFRSRKSILDAANLVFSSIMSRELGELEYDDDAALRFGSTAYPDSSDEPVELCIIDPESPDDEEAPDKSRLEARFVARKIRSLMDCSTPVYENGVPRPCRWNDFVILLRSPGSAGSVFHEELALAGIPVCSQSSGGFFESIEVSTAIDMLSLIDNPHSDIPLLSVLRSPAFGFTPDELCRIRLADRNGDMYSALLSAAQDGDEHCRSFADMLDTLRAASPDLSLDALIWRIYSSSGLLALCSAMPGGEARRENLLRLFQLAKSFEETGQKGVFQFTSWLRRMASRAQEPPAAGNGDSVSIMSIHKSKGLEFPFVFLCDLHHRFNKTDSRDCVLFHSRLGLGPKLTDTQRGIEYPTLARRAIERRIDTENLSEEMRVLYVAMTRARERLFMSACMKKPDAAMKKLADEMSMPLHPEFLRSAPSFLNWLLSAAMLDRDGLIKLSIIPAADISDAEADTEIESPAAVEADTELARQLSKALSFRYPFADSVEKPTKLSATGLERMSANEESDPDAVSLLPQRKQPSFRLPRSGDIQSAPAQRGTATHCFMQYVDFSRTGSIQELKNELERLEKAAYLSHEQAEMVDLSLVSHFFESPLGLRLRESREIYREFRFTLLVDADDPYSPPENEQVLMQGIIDCLIVEPEGLTIVDYKTDRISAAAVPKAAAHYAAQIRAYARCAQRIFGLPVRERIIYFLTPGVSFSLADE